MDILQQMTELTSKLDKALHSLPKYARAYAESTKNYRVLLAETILRLKDDGMPATIVQQVARGNQQVANAKVQELVDEAMYKATQEAINIYKLNLKLLQSQYEREYDNV